MPLTFVQIVALSRNRITAALIQRAIIADGIAKAATTARARRQIDAQRNAAVSRLVALKVAKVDDTTSSFGLVSLLLPGRLAPCLRVPMAALAPDAQHALALLRHNVLARCR